MEWILGLLIIVLGGAAIFVIYLGERISVFETLLGIHPKITTDKLAEHVNFGPNPFGELSGENLWKAMIGETIEDSNIEVGDEVVTAGGILGKVSKIGDQFLDVTLNDSLKVKVQVTAISNVLPKGTINSI